MSLILRPLTPRDFPSVDLLLRAAYSSSTSMLDEFVRYHRFQPDGWLLALRAEKPVGMGGALLYRTHARIGLMAVLPDMQHQGIGAAIMQRLLEWIANRGATTVLLDATPAGVPLYIRLGFILDDTTCAYIQRHPGRVVDAPARVTRQLAPEELPEVIKYDERRLGIQRSGILTSYNEEFADRTFVARDSQGNIAGYLIAQSHRLGPWIADTPAIAGSLLHHALHLSFSSSPMVLVPEYNQAARLLLIDAGFQAERRWQSMHVGELPDLHRRQWLYGYTNFYCG